MRHKKDVFDPFWDRCDTNGAPEKLSSFEGYLSEATLDGRYLGNLELEAACGLFNQAHELLQLGEGGYLYNFNFNFAHPSCRTRGPPFDGASFPCCSVLG